MYQIFRENERLRAENEALRTVTPMDAAAACTAYDHADGCVVRSGNAEVQRMMGAIQSFIRSKESRRG